MSHPEWIGAARLPAGAECSIATALRRRAADNPEGPFAAFQDGTTWSNAQAWDIARRTAAGLARLGVTEGSRVANNLPNSAAHFRVMLATAYLGAVAVPLHTSLRGNLLENALECAAPSVIITHEDLVETLRLVPSSAQSKIVALGADDSREEGRAGEVLALDRDLAVPACVERSPWDIAGLMFTSGTTGRSKAVRVTCAQLWTMGMVHFGHLTSDDRILVATPLSHVGGLAGLVGAIAREATVLVLGGFSTSTFWDDVRRLGATTIAGLGPTLLNFLNGTPVTDRDADNPLRIVNVAAANAAVRAFAERFKVDFFASFGMTELSVPIISEMNPAVENSCGRARDGIEIRLVDEHDLEVMPGQPGELIVRSDLPWALGDGYEGMPEATAQAWRNGWFHTGDMARMDADGNVFVLDRAKDVIRRRGENISSIELEAEVLAHPDVREAAAVGVPSEHGDEEVLLAVSPAAGRSVDPRALVEFLVPRVPHFMVPRYVRVLTELPKTPSLKIQKGVLRDEGLSQDTWDRNSTDLKVRQTRFGAIS